MRVNSEQKRRDWSIIIFILPLGLVMMMCVGQLAVRMSPNWSVSGEMNSSLDPETAPKQNALIVPPISSDILTPMSWWDTFLTPGSGEVEFPPFVTFEPTLTPSVTATPSETASPTVSPTGSVTTTPTPPTSTPTKKPDDNNTPTPPTATATTTTPTATASSTPANCTDPNATNNGGPLPCIYPIPVSSTPEGNLTPVPTQIEVGPPDGDIGNITAGNYIVITLTAAPIVVNGISDTNYDFVYYEQEQSCTVSPTCPSGTGIQMDSVIISISMDDLTYYVVFNWGNGTPDNNSNVGDVTTNTGTEIDNQIIDSSELHQGASEDTGILVDVDNAPSNPPPGDYWYVAVQAPTPDADTGTGFDSIEVAENTPAP
jgi:hypothetical protein